MLEERCSASLTSGVSIIPTLQEKRGWTRLTAHHVATPKGHISRLNELAKEYNAKAIIHTGDFGFYGQSLGSVSEVPDSA